ncbi:MAG: hypothetical protein JST65_15275 [Acidobacteria bacterium]|nr:hypothetical protein [Acidobacteriota bacterium]
MNGLSAARRKAVEEQAARLIAEEKTRRARKRTPGRMAKRRAISQEGGSRLEKPSDALLSTIRKAR